MVRTKRLRTYQVHFEVQKIDIIVFDKAIKTAFYHWQAITSYIFFYKHYIASLRHLQYTSCCVFHPHQTRTIRRNIRMDYPCDWHWRRYCSLSMGYGRTTRWMWEVSILVIISCYAQLLHVGRICGAPPHTLLDFYTCTITYTANTTLPWVIALKIEDFETSLPEKALSGTSLQFIVKVYRDTSPCKTRM